MRVGEEDVRQGEGWWGQVEAAFGPEGVDLRVFGCRRVEERRLGVSGYS